jgi:hypothetical protein
MLLRDFSGNTLVKISLTVIQFRSITSHLQMKRSSEPPAYMSSEFLAFVLSYFDLWTNVASRLEGYLTICGEKMELQREIACQPVAITGFPIEKQAQENAEAAHRYEWQQKERRYKEEIEVLERELEHIRTHWPEHSNSLPSFEPSESNPGTGPQTGLPPRNFSAVDLPRVNQSIGPSYDASGPSSPISISSDTEYTLLIDCIACKESKHKCDGWKPQCLRCSRNNRLCWYTEIRGKSGRTRGYGKAQEERLS